MIRKIVIVLVLVALLGGAYLQTQYLGDAIGELSALTKDVAAAVDTGDGAEAEVAVHALTSRWDQLKESLYILLEHTELDNIHEEISSLEAYVLSGFEQEIPASLTRLQYYFSHLLNMDQLTLSNVF